MPHLTQPQAATSPAADRSLGNGHGHADGHTAVDGQDQPVSSGADAELIDVAALIAENEGLRQRLVSQPAIDQAKGILMAHYRINSDTAFQLLRRWSQDGNTKIRHIADLLIDTATQPTGTRPAPHEIVQHALPSVRRGNHRQGLMRAAAGEPGQSRS
jgi:hypothetical protein